MKLTILPEAALDDAKNIDSIVQEISNSLEELDKIIKENIPDHLQTKWSTKLLDDWNEYYNDNEKGIKGSLAGMELSATNLKNAVDMAINYSEN